jgi:hypothetical protein
VELLLPCKVQSLYLLLFPFLAFFALLRTHVEFYRTPVQDIEFEVLRAVVIKSSVFWDTTPCIPFKSNRSFGGTIRLHFQGQRISQSRSQRTELCLLPPSSWFRTRQTLWFWR